MTPFIEIAILTFVLYHLFAFFWNTRAMDLIYGLIAFMVIFVATYWLRLPVLHKMMQYLVNVAAIALIVIFQPELRLALSRLSMKGKKYREITEFDRFLENMATSVYRLADKRIGAIILLENQDSLDQYSRDAVFLNAEFSSEILESIFSTTTPLHDGAVIIRGTTVLAAAAILPLADGSPQLTKSMGTRHRAALGISQLTDALVIVVSEESGKVSIARDGIITRGVKMDRFKGILRSIFNPPKSGMEVTYNMWDYVRKWINY
ncbi:MAG: diadenylate cyclase CdaA [Chlamydiales bacterium]